MNIGSESQAFIYYKIKGIRRFLRSGMVASFHTTIKTCH